MALEQVKIDYGKIDDAVHFYGRHFQFIEVPWFVSRKAMEVTAPPGRRFCSSFLGDMVASGEQSFIQLWVDKKFEKGKFACVTPCFRDDEIDNLHFNYFMKVELIDLCPDNVEVAIDNVVSKALEFFSYYLDPEVIDTEIGKDVVYNGVELGSYGFRSSGEMRWVYGTGCAEPRLSQALL